VEGEAVIGVHQARYPGAVRGEAPDHPGLGRVRVHDVERPAAEPVTQPRQRPPVAARRDRCPQRGLEEDFQPGRGSLGQWHRAPAPGDDRHFVARRVEAERPAQRVLARPAL
jgi:hypothetical protein